MFPRSPPGLEVTVVRPGWVRRVEGAAPPGGAGSGGQAALGRGWSEGRGRAVGACEPPLQQSGQPGRHLSQSPPAGPLIPVLLGPQSPCGWTPGRTGRVAELLWLDPGQGGRAGGQCCPDLSLLLLAGSCFRAASSSACSVGTTSGCLAGRGGQRGPWAGLGPLPGLRELGGLLPLALL